MSHGLPDFYRGVDIAYQALGEMIVRPKYGAANRAVGGGAVSGVTQNELISVAGKGIIYGGLLYAYNSESLVGDSIYYEIDGNQVAYWSFYNLAKYNITKGPTIGFYLLKYDDVKFVYSVAFSSGLTFESSFLVRYDSTVIAAHTAWCHMFYALI